MSNRPRRPQRWPAWLALLAAWSLALLPTLSQALAAHTGEAGWVEVCTAQGSRWVPLAPADAAGDAGDAAPGEPTGSAAVAFEHCPWCGSHAGDAALPAPAASLLVPARGEPPATAVRRGAPAAPAWPGARPRAPPRIAA